MTWPHLFFMLHCTPERWDVAPFMPALQYQYHTCIVIVLLLMLLQLDVLFFVILVMSIVGWCIWYTVEYSIIQWYCFLIEPKV